MVGSQFVYLNLLHLLLSLKTYQIRIFTFLIISTIRVCFFYLLKTAHVNFIAHFIIYAIFEIWIPHFSNLCSLIMHLWLSFNDSPTWLVSFIISIFNLIYLNQLQHCFHIRIHSVKLLVYYFIEEILFSWLIDNRSNCFRETCSSLLQVISLHTVANLIIYFNFVWKSLLVIIFQFHHLLITECQFLESAMIILRITKLQYFVITLLNLPNILKRPE